MHGEYKTPGGKLVAVDFELLGERLHRVQVHGDFFLYPEDVLTVITSALEGAPAGLTEEELADRIGAAIPAGTEWLGASPRALAIAVGRALQPEEQPA